MKIAAAIVGGLLGAAFIFFSVMVLFHLVPMPPPPTGTPVASFMEAFIPTGWMVFVKICELVGGLLVAIPKTRNFGLLILGPIVINIVCFHVLVTKGEGLMGPPLVLALMAAFLLFAERRKFAALLN